MTFSPVSWDELVLVLIEEGKIAIQNELYTDEYYLKEEKKNPEVTSVLSYF